jgi:AbiV family abortive infection protein
MSEESPQIRDLHRSIAEIRASGDRLAEDAQYLYEYDRFPTAYSLCILAQEEFAKAFLLQLVIDGSIPWNLELQRALRSHSCKQLAALIMDFLQRKDFFLSYPNEDWIKRVSEVPVQILDAIHLLVNEFVYDRRRSDWLDPESRPLDPLARKVADGMIDRKKQSGFYVQLAFNGTVASSPLQVTQASSLAELERTRRIRDLISVSADGSTSALSLEYHHILAVFKVLTGAMSKEDFDVLW